MGRTNTNTKSLQKWRRNLDKELFTTCMSFYTAVSLQTNYKIMTFTTDNLVYWQLPVTRYLHNGLDWHHTSLCIIPSFFPFSTLEIYLTNPKCREKKDEENWKRGRVGQRQLSFWRNFRSTASDRKITWGADKSPLL